MAQLPTTFRRGTLTAKMLDQPLVLISRCDGSSARSILGYWFVRTLACALISLLTLLQCHCRPLQKNEVAIAWLVLKRDFVADGTSLPAIDKHTCVTMTEQLMESGLYFRRVPLDVAAHLLVKPALETANEIANEGTYATVSLFFIGRRAAPSLPGS